MTGSDYDDNPDCPLCCTELDLTDRSIQYCSCGYHMCLWCYHHILEEAGKESVPARCPNCRSVYDQEKITVQHIDAEKLEEEKRKMKEKDKKPGAAAAAAAAEVVPKSRANLTNVRVVQPNLVYAVGLPLELCNEDVLREPEYFGQFGKVFKISVNRSNQYASALAKHGPTGSAYVTFRRPEDALRCIRLLDGSLWKGKPIKACFGTTKYCNAFLKGLTCNNPDCLYLHDLADEADCLTKEEVAAGLLPARFMAMGASNTFKPRLTINPIPSAATSLAQAAAAAAVAAGQPQGAGQTAATAAAAGGVNRSGSATVLVATRSAAVSIAPRIVLNDGGGSGAWGSPSVGALAGAAGTSAPKSGASWAAVSVGATPAPVGPPPPPPTDDQEWPELGGPGGPSGQPSGAASPEREDSSDTLQRGGSLAANGGTMAEQLARAHSNPPDKLGAAAAPKAKKLLALSSPGKLKPLSKPSAAQRPVQPAAAAESSSTAGATAPAAASEAAGGSSKEAAPNGVAEPQQRLSAPAAAAAEHPARANGIAAAAVVREGASAAAAPKDAEQKAAQPLGEGAAPFKRLAPPPGFAAPAAAAAAAARPKKITPPPGFGGPVVSNGPTPSASNHTSVDSVSQLGPDAEAARATARAAAAAGPEQQQQQDSLATPFSSSTFGGGGAAAGSLFSSYGSSSSLTDRLPSTGDLLAAGSEAAAPPPAATVPLATGRRTSRFKFAQTDANAGPGPLAATPEQSTGFSAGPPGFAPPANQAAALPHQPPLPAAAAGYNPLSVLQQQQQATAMAPAQMLHQQHPPQQQQQQQAADAGAFFKSLFPGVSINVTSAPAPVRQPPPGFAHVPPSGAGGLGGGYGSTDSGLGGGGNGLFARNPSPPAGPYPGTSPGSSSMYNPLAGMFASPQQPPQYQHQHAQQQQQAMPGLGMGGGGTGGLSPGLALLRQLQSAGAGQHQAAQQQAAALHHQQQAQAAALHQQQQAAQAQQHALYQQQLHMGGAPGFTDPAIMAARPAAPPGFGSSSLGMSAAGLGYDRPRHVLPPPGFQF